ncbi:MAG: hypothetical protein PF447_13285 [Spirochaetaceae bacterium]|jgi:hypothetical protein|nr:hypothetical protein [Spirochaetaceae bacterium]
MKKLLYLLCIFLLSSTLWSQQQSQEEALEIKGHNIGVMLGNSLGYGLTYRYWPDRLGVQLTFSPSIDYGNQGFIVGGSFFYTIQGGKITQLFFYTGGQYAFNYYQNDFWFYDESTETNFDYSIGAGPGLEIRIINHIAMDFLFGYSYSPADMTVNFSFDTGIFYRY